MDGLILQVLALLILAAAVGAGYWRWIRPHHLPLETQGVLLLIVLTLAGGLLGSVAWWTDNPAAFSWDLPPLASRMLAAAGWAFGAATLLALQRPLTGRIQLVLVMLAVYLIPLTLAIVLFHFDRFDFAAPISYAFFAIVIAIILPTIWYLVRRPIVIPDAALPQPPPQPIRVWLTLVLVLMGLWGVALFVTDSGALSLLWVWQGDLLTTRLIAVMLLTIAAASAYSLRDGEAASMTLTVIVVYGFGAALATLWNLTAGKPVPIFYLSSFSVAGVVSLYLLLQSRRRVSFAAG